MDVYTFTAKPGQEVYFQTIKHPGNAFLTNWRLYDDIGTEIFNTCLQCGDKGLTQLERGGVYTLAVGKDTDNSTGAYQIKIWDVPPAQEFTVNIGDEISRDVPGPGAGYIETPGVKDIYTFTAEAGKVIVLEFHEEPRQQHPDHLGFIRRAGFSSGQQLLAVRQFAAANAGPRREI